MHITALQVQHFLFNCIWLCKWCYCHNHAGRLKLWWLWHCGFRCKIKVAFSLSTHLVGYWSSSSLFRKFTAERRIVLDSHNWEGSCVKHCEHWGRHCLRCCPRDSMTNLCRLCFCLMLPWPLSLFHLPRMLSYFLPKIHSANYYFYLNFTFIHVALKFSGSDRGKSPSRYNMFRYCINKYNLFTDNKGIVISF